MSLEEKIKQIFGKYRKSEVMDWRKRQVDILRNEVLKILEGKVVVEKQKLRELEDLLKNLKYQIEDSKKTNTFWRIDAWLEKYEKKFAELGLDTKKEKLKS